MPTEEKLENIQKQIERNMTQIELANLMGESRFKVNQAIKGNNTKGAIEVRKKIYKVLGMED